MLNNSVAIATQKCAFTQVLDKKGKNGGRTWARTKDPLIKSQLLYQLSYASTPVFPVTANRGEASNNDCLAVEKGFLASTLIVSTRLLVPAVHHHQRTHANHVREHRLARLSCIATSRRDCTGGRCGQEGRQDRKVETHEISLMIRDWAGTPLLRIHLSCKKSRGEEWNGLRGLGWQADGKPDGVVPPLTYASMSTRTDRFSPVFADKAFA